MTAPEGRASPALRVYKFGGTSVGDAQRIRHVASLVADCPGRPVVVVSAVGGVTDRLEALLRRGGGPHDPVWAEELGSLESLHLQLLADVAPATSETGDAAARIRSILARIGEMRSQPLESRREEEGLRAEISATGEDLSVALISAALQERGLPALPVDARDLIRTEARQGVAIPRDDETVRLIRDRLLPLVEDERVPVIQGYIGATEDGRTTTLGRGGSDFTAAIVGAALEAGEVTIWTDVEGIRTADPRIVPEARLLPELGFEEAVELAYFGARVIHPAAAKHAAARQVSLRIRSSFAPEAPGTLIRSDRREGPAVAAVAHRGGVALISVRSRPLFMAHGFLARVFEVLARYAVPVDLVATSHTSTAFTIDRNEELAEVTEELEAFAEVSVREGLATVTVVGRGLLGRPGIAGSIFRALGERPVHLISQASDVSLSFLVEEEGAAAVVRRLHEELIEEGEAT